MNKKTLHRTERLTQQGESDPENEDQDTTEQWQQKVTGDHDSEHKQSGVLPFEVFDCSLVFSGPHRTSKDQSHHRTSQNQAEGI